jgi:DNA-binding XRE family transcriptional regulator
MRNAEDLGKEVQVVVGVGRDLAMVRQRSKMTQDMVARRLGASRSTIAKMERGGSPQIPLVTLIRWAWALGVDLNVSFTAKDTR